MSGYTRPDLEPISFDDLPLGGEWTTRRRTISESEIALFAAVAGDFSPLTIDATPRRRPRSRLPPCSWRWPSAWARWTCRCPRSPSGSGSTGSSRAPVRAGDTIYARWTLTQKRPPVGGAPTAIVVWRVDVHTADGALCAEGEVGASVLQAAEASTATRRARRRPRRRRRRAAPARHAAAQAAAAPPPAARGQAASRRSRGGAGRGRAAPPAARPAPSARRSGQAPAAAPARQLGAGAQRRATPASRGCRWTRRPPSAASACRSRRRRPANPLSRVDPAPARP